MILGKFLVLALLALVVSSVRHPYWTYYDRSTARHTQEAAQKFGFRVFVLPYMMVVTTKWHVGNGNVYFDDQIYVK